ncbi:Hypothetical predicted protein [Lecanosticta acicola]|uniref:F-box domain-containing protein n=1 Tax=Lecanosticta acicola TaxID=111012 RepID=A0AAI9E7W1_9PEZI|nr:Hypothetical predicted protein [Lecanosticta acicola]
MNAATQVFNISELLELILLSLPNAHVYQELNAIRTILLAQTTSHTWHSLIHTSTPIRQLLYLPTPPIDAIESPQAWDRKHAFPPARPNPWIPNLLLNQRSWGSAYPFETHSLHHHHHKGTLQPSQPRFWTFSFEISKAQYERLLLRGRGAAAAPTGPWRGMLLTSPPFYDFWYTRCFYELGSGRAPFVTHVDYDATLPKSEQENRVHCPDGVTLGHVVDALGGMFEKHANAKFVMVESLRMPDGDGDLSEDRPTTKTYIPGSSAEKGPWMV